MLENAITELTAVCRELLQELRSRPVAQENLCQEATLVEVETTPTQQSTETPATDPVPAEQAEEPMSPEKFAAAGTKLTNELKQIIGSDNVKATMRGLYATFGVAKSPMELPAEKRRDFIAALESTVVEARHDR